MKFPDLLETAKSLNWAIFNNLINLDQVNIEYKNDLPESIWGLTIGFEKIETLERFSLVYIKPAEYVIDVLAHELVHVFQIQKKQKLNHNGAFMRYYEKRAKEIGIEIDMGIY